MVAVILASCGTKSSAPVATTSAATTTSMVTSTTTTVMGDPGLLPQTSAKPTASGPSFNPDVKLLWQAIQSGDPQIADPFFFPLSAYIQVKAISDPVHDYDTRLIYAFDTDLLSYHRTLLKAGSAAKLIGLSVPEQAAKWIVPGVEYNKGSYWRVYGSRLYYSVNGVTHYFPIYSLISWRGQWYVVHVGLPTS